MQIFLDTVLGTVTVLGAMQDPKSGKLNIVMWNATSAITGERISLILVESYNDFEHLIALKLGRRVVLTATGDFQESRLIAYAKAELAAVDATWVD